MCVNRATHVGPKTESLRLTVDETKLKLHTKTNYILNTFVSYLVWRSCAW